MAILETNVQVSVMDRWHLRISSVSNPACAHALAGEATECRQVSMIDPSLLSFSLVWTIQGRVI